MRWGRGEYKGCKQSKFYGRKKSGGGKIAYHKGLKSLVFGPGKKNPKGPRPDGKKGKGAHLTESRLAVVVKRKDKRGTVTEFLSRRGKRYSFLITENNSHINSKEDCQSNPLKEKKKERKRRYTPFPLQTRAERGLFDVGVSSKGKLVRWLGLVIPEKKSTLDCRRKRGGGRTMSIKRKSETSDCWEEG